MRDKNRRPRPEDRPLLADPVAMDKKIRELETRMQRHARDLEFEQAAKVRDEIHRLREAQITV